MTNNPVSILDFGAVGDGKTDNTKAIQAAFDFAKIHDRPVYIPKGVFNHSGRLFADSITVEGVGHTGSGKSVLHATNPSTSALKLKGNDPSISGIEFTTVGAPRGTAGAAIATDFASGFSITDCRIIGPGSGGIFVYGSSNGRIANNLITDNVADSIHMTRQGTHHILVENNRIERSGDDSIAVVSYGKDITKAVHHITVRNNTILDQRGGRGATVVGGHDVVIQGNHIEGGPNGRAGVYIAAEKSYETAGVYNIKVLGNTVKNAGGTQTGHGAIHVYNGQPDNIVNHHITIEGNDIVSAKKSGIVVNGGPNNQDITIHNNDIFAPASGKGVVLFDSPKNIKVLDNPTLPLSSYPGDMVPVGGVGNLPPVDPNPGSTPTTWKESAAPTNNSIGTSASEVLNGTSGNDKMSGGDGDDRLVGGAGDDTYIVNSGDTVVELAGGGIDTVHQYIASYTLTDYVQNLIIKTSTGATAIGNALDNIVVGGIGNDVLNGGAGNDRLTGGAGADKFVIIAGQGNDTITDFGTGDKIRLEGTGFKSLTEVATAVHQNGTDAVLTIGNGQELTIKNVQASVLTASRFELGGVVSQPAKPDWTPGDWKVSATPVNTRTGTSASETLNGTKGPDKISGGGGNDHLVGGKGDDTYDVNSADVVIELYGGGIDTVHQYVASYTLADYVQNLIIKTGTGAKAIGNALDNIIDGGIGNDVLDGGAGKDKLIGEAGNDVFVLRKGMTQGDLIMDFKGNGTAVGDQLRLEGFGRDAKLVHVDDHWTVQYTGGAETFKVVGVTELATNDFVFA